MAKEQSEKDQKRIAQLQKWWGISETKFDEWAPQGKRDLDFYLGAQWDAADLNKLKSESRPALTFNMIKSPVNLVSGHERQNKRDLMVVNKKGGSRVVADVLTKLLKDIMDNRNGDHEKSHAFLKGIITARGYLKIGLNFDDDIINGDIIIEEVSPFRVYPDPFFEKYDMRDGMFVFVAAWLPKDKIENTFPEKKDELENFEVDDDDRVIVDMGSKYRDSVTDSSVTDIKEYKYRVKECWWIEYQKAVYVINTQTSKVMDATEWPQKRLNQALKIFPHMKRIERSKKVLRLTTYVGSVILQDIEDPFSGITDFPIVPYFAYFIEGRWRSLITDLIDPQQEINKRRSQLLHHLNQSANSGWMGDENAVSDWSMVENFGSKPGIIIKIRKGKKLTRIEPVRLSEGHLMLARESGNDIKGISGVNADLLGLTPEHNESGVAMQLRHRQGNIVLESLFDNLKLTEKILGKRLIDFIQRSGAYSQEEMVKIIIDGKPKDVQVNQKIRNEFGAIQKIQNDLSIGRYDVTVTTSPQTPTVRLTNLTTMLELTKLGLPIPLDLILDQTDFARKEEVLERIKAQQGQKQPSKEETEGRLKQQEIVVNAAIKREEIAINADIKREEIAMKRNIEILKIKAKHPTFTI